MFADPSGRRALTMGGLGLTMAAATLAALAIVVTAAIGFTSVPSLRLSHPLGAHIAFTSHHIDRRFDRHRFAALSHVASSKANGASDAAADRHTHA